MRGLTSDGHAAAHGAHNAGSDGGPPKASLTQVETRQTTSRQRPWPCPAAIRWRQLGYRPLRAARGWRPSRRADSPPFRGSSVALSGRHRAPTAGHRKGERPPGEHRGDSCPAIQQSAVDAAGAAAMSVSPRVRGMIESGQRTPSLGHVGRIYATVPAKNRAARVRPARHQPASVQSWRTGSPKRPAAAAPWWRCASTARVPRLRRRNGGRFRRNTHPEWRTTRGRPDAGLGGAPLPGPVGLASATPRSPAWCPRRGLHVAAHRHQNTVSGSPLLAAPEVLLQVVVFTPSGFPKGVQTGLVKRPGPGGRLGPGGCLPVRC